MFDSFRKKIHTLRSGLNTYSIGLLQDKAYRILKYHTTSLLKDKKLSTIEWALLGLLFEQKEGLKLSKVALELGVEAPFVTEILSELTKKELVEITKPLKDRRVKVLKISNHGAKLVPEIEAMLREKTKPMLNGLNIRELLTYQKVLKTIIKNSKKPS